MMWTKQDMTVKPVPVGASHHKAHIAFTGSHSWCPVLKARFPLHKSGSFPSYGRALRQISSSWSMNFRPCFLHGCRLAFFRERLLWSTSKMVEIPFAIHRLTGFKGSFWKVIPSNHFFGWVIFWFSKVQIPEWWFPETCWVTRANTSHLTGFLVEMETIIGCWYYNQW